MIECVPNFSEGRDAAKVRAIVDAIASAPGVLLLGWESDADHNRSVVTFAGEPDAVVEGAIRGAGKAAELIDLNRHEGVHPRVGAADVIPFVPLEGATLERVRRRSRIAPAKKSGGASACRCISTNPPRAAPERQRLENVRRRGFDGAPPDIGDIAAHPTAGASVVGARGFLIAYNVDLATPRRRNRAGHRPQDSRIVGRIPLRQSHGRVPAIARLRPGFDESDEFRGDSARSRLSRRSREEAARLGTAIRSSQLIGFIPRRAFELAPDFFRRAENFDESRIMETRIEQSLQ